MFTEIEIKPKKSFTIYPAIGLTGILLLLINDHLKELFTWHPFNPNGINNIVITFFILISIISWVFYFDDKPTFKISKEGIWHRKIFFIKSLNQLASWSEVEYYFIEAVTDKFYSEELIIKLKSQEKYLKIGLTGSNVSKEELLNIMTSKSKEFHFHDLGFESNRYSKYE